MSQRSRIALHSISHSVVLPEPTGPPMPTRSGPWGGGHERNSLVYWVSWRIEQRSTVSVAVPSSSSGQAGARAATARDVGSRAAWRAGRRSGPGARGGRRRRRGWRRRPGGRPAEQRQGDAVAGGDGADGQRVGQAGPSASRAGRRPAGSGQLREAGAGEGLALGAGLQRQLGGGRQAWASVRRSSQAVVVVRAAAAWAWAQQHRVDPAAAVAQHGGRARTRDRRGRGQCPPRPPIPGRGCSCRRRPGRRARARRAGGRGRRQCSWPPWP